mmetsp:Transcript_16365/g.45083  ORF Transcript_16365/g.45083 Transcript_16365/m.45083 type:complete len:338 (-) Transcript_16365:178-1191(-)
MPRCIGISAFECGGAPSPSASSSPGPLGSSSGSGSGSSSRPPPASLPSAPSPPAPFPPPSAALAWPFRSPCDPEFRAESSESGTSDMKWAGTSLATRKLCSGPLARRESGSAACSCTASATAIGAWNVTSMIPSCKFTDLTTFTRAASESVASATALANSLEKECGRGPFTLRCLSASTTSRGGKAASLVLSSRSSAFILPRILSWVRVALEVSPWPAARPMAPAASAAGNSAARAGAADAEDGSAAAATGAATPAAAADGALASGAVTATATANAFAAVLLAVAGFTGATTLAAVLLATAASAAASTAERFTASAWRPRCPWWWRWWWCLWWPWWW